jgi:parvulin-like peptidyl-prolyl isomerase
MTRFANMLVLVTMGLAACNGAPPTGEKSGGLDAVAREGRGEPIATVGPNTIGSEEVEMEAALVTPEDGAQLSAEERTAIVDKLVAEEVLFLKALDKGLYNDSKVRNMLVNLLLREEVYSQVSEQDFSAEELEAYYEAHKEDFVVPEKRQIKRIYLKVSPERDLEATRALAKRLHGELKAEPRLFAEVAAANSEGPYKRRGGDTGFITREGKPGLQPEMVEHAFTLPVGELAEPFETEDGIHILYVVNHKERVERPFAQMRASVVRLLKQERYKTLTEAYIEEAKKGIEIAIDEKKLEALELRPRTPRGPGGRAIQAPGGDNHGH